MSELSTEKVALITGGIGGIGTATCHNLATAGYRVVATYRAADREQKAREWQQAFSGKGLEVDLVCMDISDPDSCQRAAGEILDRYGKLDILVNNGGITRDSVMKKMSLKQWQEVIHTNLDSVFNVTHCFLQNMLDNGYGRIINISSVNAQKGQFGQVNYSAAKAGIHGFTKALAQEVARKGITVNTLSPGYIATDMVMAVPEEVREKIRAGIPVGRFGKPEEIARVIAFLADENSGFITGADFSVNGGMHMH